jgi:rod shape-determining protein MreD
MNWLNSILILLVAFIAVFMEAVFDGARNLLGAQIDLLPALMVYASLSSGLLTITTLAVAGGLWFDTLSANPLGISILPLFLPGYLIYLRRELILRDQFYAQLVLGLVASAVTPLLALLLLSVTRQAPLLGWDSVWQWIVMSIGGALLTPFCFRLFDGLNHALNYRPVVETSFRLDRQIKRGRK